MASCPGGVPIADRWGRENSRGVRWKDTLHLYWALRQNPLGEDEKIPINFSRFGVRESFTPGQFPARALTASELLVWCLARPPGWKTHSKRSHPRLCTPDFREKISHLGSAQGNWQPQEHSGRLCPSHCSAAACSKPSQRGRLAEWNLSRNSRPFPCQLFVVGGAFVLLR